MFSGKLFFIEHYVQVCYIDKYINVILQKNTMDFKIGEKVQLTIGHPSNIGFNVYINDEKINGLLYHNEIFEPLEIGQKKEGYIKKIREDGKIDVSLQPMGFENAINRNATIIMDKLKQHKGVLKLTDKSTPTQIMHELNLSKKSFKSAIGYLYKQHKITIKEDGVYLVK